MFPIVAGRFNGLQEVALLLVGQRVLMFSPMCPVHGCNEELVSFFGNFFSCWEYPLISEIVLLHACLNLRELAHAIEVNTVLH